MTAPFERVFTSLYALFTKILTVPLHVVGVIREVKLTLPLYTEGLLEELRLKVVSALPLCKGVGVGADVGVGIDISVGVEVGTDVGVGVGVGRGVEDPSLTVKGTGAVT